MTEKRFTDDQESLICLSYIKGKKLVDIAREWNCPHSTIINVLERAGIDARKRRAIRGNLTGKGEKKDVSERGT